MNTQSPSDREPDASHVRDADVSDRSNEPETAVEESGAPDGAPLLDAGDAALSPVRLGVAPNAAELADGGASAESDIAAHLQTLAAGSRIVPLKRRWNELFDEGGQPNEAAWQVLTKLLELYRDAGQKVLLCLAVVDGEVDTRPSGATAPWSEQQGPFASLVGRLAATGTALHTVSVGYEVDRHLHSLSGAEREQFESFLLDAVALANNSLPAEVQVGTSFSYAGVVGNDTPELETLLAESEALIVDYYGVDAAFRALPPTQVDRDLARLVEVAAGMPGIPLVLQEVGYPSAMQVGSSPEQQADFYEHLLDWVARHRGEAPLVGINGLRDASPTACEQHAAALGAQEDVAARRALCSLGLHDADGLPKPAWAVVLDGLASFRAP